MTPAERALKILRYLKRHVEIKTDGGWTLESDKRRIDATALTIDFKYVVDHHQAAGCGQIQRHTLETQTVKNHIRNYQTPPKERDGKLVITIDQRKRQHEVLCNPDDLLLVDRRQTPLAAVNEKGVVIREAVEHLLAYDGGC